MVGKGSEKLTVVVLETLQGDLQLLLEFNLNNQSSIIY